VEIIFLLNCIVSLGSRVEEPLTVSGPQNVLPCFSAHASMLILSLGLLLLLLVLNLFLSFALFHLLSSGRDALGEFVAVYDKSRHEPRKESGVGRVSR
jgi:hypothetical protein